VGYRWEGGDGGLRREVCGSPIGQWKEFNEWMELNSLLFPNSFYLVITSGRRCLASHPFSFDSTVIACCAHHLIVASNLTQRADPRFDDGGGRPAHDARRCGLLC